MAVIAAGVRWADGSDPISNVPQAVKPSAPTGPMRIVHGSRGGAGRGSQAGDEPVSVVSRAEQHQRHVPSLVT